MSIQLIIDDREHMIIPYFDNAKIPPNISYNVSRIEYGDYAVLYKGRILFIIERKSWKDLANSIKDGRKENVKKMLKMREETKCKLFYLIEGNPTPSPTTKFCRIPYKNMRSHLDHLSFRDDIHILYSKNKHTTCDRIIEIIKNYTTITPSPIEKINSELNENVNTNINQIDNVGGDLSKLKIRIPITPEAIIYKIWCCIPHITEKSASLFINKGYHISDLILGNITKDTIFALKYSNGGIIGKRSEKIWKYSRYREENYKYFAKMLNGITSATSSIILNKIKWCSLLEGKISIETISQIQKSDSGRKIGKKVSSEIIKYFVYVPLIENDKE